MLGFNLNIAYMMQKMGVEPTRDIIPQRPQRCVSAIPPLLQGKLSAEKGTRTLTVLSTCA